VFVGKAQLISFNRCFSVVTHTIFLNLQKLTASQKEWTEILNLHFFSSSDQLIVIERFDPLLLVKIVTIVVTTPVFILQ